MSFENPDWVYPKENILTDRPAPPAARSAATAAGLGVSARAAAEAVAKEA